MSFLNEKNVHKQFQSVEISICYLLLYVNVPYTYFSKSGATLVLLFD